MVTLIAFLSTGKGTWGHVIKLMNGGTFDKILLITNDWGVENFSNAPEHAELIPIDNRKPIDELIADMKQILSDKLSETEVAVNLWSGSGAEHMALISAILSAGLSLKMIVADEDDVKEI